MGISNFFRESFIICRRQLRMNLRTPAWIIIGLLQPVMYLVLFGPLLKPLTAQFGATNAYTFFVPGLLVQLTVFGAMFVGFGVIAEWRDGVIEAERVTPASRTALLCGRLMRDVTQLGVQSTILIALGYAMGMKAPIAGVVLGMIITLFAGAASAAASNALALTSKDEDVMGPLTNMLIMPILLLSGIILPMSLAPAWLERLSDFMPTRYIVDAVRAIFAENPDAATVTWGILWSLVIFFAGIWWGTRTFRKENS